MGASTLKNEMDVAETEKEARSLAGMYAAETEKEVRSPAEMDAAETEKEVRSPAEMDAAETEKAARSPAKMDAAAMEKAERMEKAAKLRARREAARRRREEYARRTGIRTPPGAVYLDRSNCHNFDIDGFLGLNRTVDKEEFLTVEKLVWKASMAYLKSNDNIHDYELLPHNMTLYPVVYDKHIWYHCNIVGRRTGVSQSSPPTVFFVELKFGSSYHVMGCTPIDHNSYHDCKSCPPSCSIMHPMKEEFICGSEEGQQLFHYSIPGEPLSLGPSYNGARTLPVAATPKTSEGTKVIKNHALEISSDESINVGRKGLLGADFLSSC